jgi:threonine/homoserine/homoserine lactone efflux protein
MPNLTPFLVYAFVTTFTPGPNNLMAMTNAIQYGYRRTFGFLLGMTAGFAVVMLACALLNAALARLLPQAQFWLELAGAAYLLYLALHTIFSKPPVSEMEPARLNTFWVGLTLQFLNLKVILYGVTIFSLFITPVFANPWTVGLFAPLLAALGFASVSCWAFGGALFRGFWLRHYRAFSLVMGTFLIYSAAASLWGH